MNINNTHIGTDGLFVLSDVKNKNATVSIQSTIQNQNLNAANCTVTSYITNRDGNIIGKSTAQPISITSKNTKTIIQKITVTNPKLWSVDNPYLYRAIVLVKNNNNIIDSEKIRFGIRTINVTDSGLFVNGVYTKIHGMCNHQDALELVLLCRIICNIIVFDY